MTVSLYSDECEFVKFVYITTARMGRNGICGPPGRQGSWCGYLKLSYIALSDAQV